MFLQYAAMTFDKSASAGYLANHMARLFARGLRARIEPLGLTVGQFPVMLELWEGDGLTQKELRVRLDIEQATIANTLNRMERDGLIRRTRNEGDARVQRVWLTERARTLRAPAYAAATAQNAAALASLTEAERARFLHDMERVIASMQESEGG